MTTETLMTDGQNTQAADQQQSATSHTEGHPAAGGEQTEQQQQQATDGKSADGQQAGGDKTEGEQAKPQGAPEKYEFKAPEGTTFDDAVLGAYSEVAKELNLSQEAAQKVLDKVAPVIQARQAEQIEAMRTAWAQSAMADKEFGGDKLSENLATAKKALDTFGTPELRKLLNETGLGNNPEVIRAFYRAGKAISEDKFVGGKGAPPAADDVRSLYPNSNLK
jgi:hypothetical protein